MPRGAPKGNQYAKKEKPERGISFSYYINAYDYEFLQQSVRYDGQEPTDENVRARAKELTEKAIGQEVRRVFARHTQEQQKAEVPNDQHQ